MNALALALNVPKDADVAAVVHDAAMTVVPLVEDESDPEALLDYLSRWSAFMTLVEARRKRARGRSEAVARIIELRLAEVMDGVPQGQWPEAMTHNDVTELRTMFKFRHVAEEVIAESTNSKPATRWRVCERIRLHRVESGELMPRPGEVKRHLAEQRRQAQKMQREAEAAREIKREQAERAALEARKRAEMKSLADKAGRRASNAYGLLRRLQAEIDAIEPGTWAGHAHQNDAARLLVGVEKAVLEMLRAERAQEEPRR